MSRDHKRTQAVLEATLPRILELARAKVSAGIRLAEIAAFVDDEDGRIGFIVDTRDVILGELRQYDPPPKSTIAGFDEPDPCEGQLRLITRSTSDGWGTHWTPLQPTPLSKGGDA